MLPLSVRVFSSVPWVSTVQSVVVVFPDQTHLHFWSLFCYALLNVLSSFAIILIRQRELVALLLLSSCCLVTLSVLWLFLVVPWVGLQWVIVVVSNHIHLLVGYLAFLITRHIFARSLGRQGIELECISKDTPCHGLVCHLWLWHFLVILICLLIHVKRI